MHRGPVTSESAVKSCLFRVEIIGIRSPELFVPGMNSDWLALRAVYIPITDAAAIGLSSAEVEMRMERGERRTQARDV